MDQRSQALSSAFFFCALFFPVQLPGNGLQTLFETTGADFQSHGRSLIRLIAVQHPELERIYSGFLSQLVHVALQSPRVFGIAVAAHGLAVGVVCVDQPRIEIDIGDAVE